MNKRKQTRARGFTLIELLVVIAIIALLIGMVLPAVNMARLRMYSAASAAHIYQLAGGGEAYKTDTGFYPAQLLIANAASSGGGNPIGKYVANVAYFGSQILGACVYGYKLSDIDDGTIEPQDTYLSSTSRDLITLKVSYGGNPVVYVQCPGLLSDKFGGMERSILYYPSRIGATGLSQYIELDNEKLSSAAGTAWYAYGDTTTGQSNFQQFIKDRRLGVTTAGKNNSTTPYNPDRFLLNAAGLDRLNGTVDDLKNY